MKIRNKSIEKSRGIELEDYLFSVSGEESNRIEKPLEKKKIEFL
jgi:hypothetical protein